MTTIAEVRDGLCLAIRSGCGMRAIPYALDTLPAPCAVVTRMEMDPRMVLSKAKAAYPFKVSVFAFRAAEKSAQKKLDVLTEATGDGSFVVAVEDGANWPDDLVDYCSVTSIGEPYQAVIAEETYLAVDFDIEVVF